MTKSRADQHDKDKLSRWNRDLDAATTGQFPVYALFLVTGDDRHAHDIFREFRSSFEARGPGFEHLIIFGQHGLSCTVEGFLDGFELELDALPLLALFREPSASEVYILALPEAGDHWRDILRGLESAVDGAPGTTFHLDSLPGVNTFSLRHGSMGSLSAGLLGKLSRQS